MSKWIEMLRGVLDGTGLTVSGGGLGGKSITYYFFNADRDHALQGCAPTLACAVGYKAARSVAEAIVATRAAVCWHHGVIGRGGREVEAGFDLTVNHVERLVMLAPFGVLSPDGPAPYSLGSWVERDGERVTFLPSPAGLLVRAHPDN